MTASACSGRFSSRAGARARSAARTIASRFDRWACAAIAAVSLAGAIAYATTDRPERSAPLFAAAMAALALFIPRPAIPRSLFAGAVALDAWLTASGAFDSFNRGDHVGHLVLTGLLVLLLAGMVPVGRSETARFLALTGVGASAGLLWELLELASDAWLGTDMSLGWSDSILDFISDVAGAALAAWWLVRRERTAAAPSRTKPL